MTPRLPRLYWITMSIGITSSSANHTVVGSNSALPFNQSGS